MSTFAAQIGWEFRKLLAGRQAWLGPGAVVAFELVVTALTRLERVRPALIDYFQTLGYDFERVFSGLTLAQHLVGFAVAGPGALCIALVTAQTLAGEWEHGTLTALLARPVSRRRVWCVKLVACAGYSIGLVVLASVVALVLGLAAEGAGPLLVHVPATRGRWLYAFGDGLLLFAWGVAFHALAMLTVTCTAFALASLPMRAATAAIATIAYLFADDALRQMPFLASLRSWFVMTHVTSWSRVFDAAADWGWVREVYGPLALYDAAVLAAGLLVFTRRDFTR